MGRLISLIYFYLVSVIGLILLIIGLYNSVSYGFNVTQYDKYPLRYAGNENCEFISRSAAPVKPLVAPDAMPTIDNIEIDRQTKECETRVERERKQAMVDDMKNSVFFTLVGAILLAIHLPIAVKKSSEKKA